MNYTIYRLFDYWTGHYVGPEFSCPKKFFEYHCVKTFDGKHPWWIDRALTYYIHYDHHKYFKAMLYGKYTIKNELGRNYENILAIYKIAVDKGFYPWKKRYYGYQDYDYYWWEKKLQRLKCNILKLKDPHRIYGWYRRIRTTNEHRQNEAHIREHGPDFVRPKRRKYNLPTSWDDPPVSAWETKKSWKHNSKRKHQWKPK